MSKIRITQVIHIYREIEVEIPRDGMDDDELKEFATTDGVPNYDDPRWTSKSEVSDEWVKILEG